jgi:hypothetical protein
LSLEKNPAMKNQVPISCEDEKKLNEIFKELDCYRSLGSFTKKLETILNL